MQADYVRDEVEVLNAGVPGYNSWESAIDFQTRVLDAEPDLVVVFFGVNDVHARLVDSGAQGGRNRKTPGLVGAVGNARDACWDASVRRRAAWRLETARH